MSSNQKVHHWTPTNMHGVIPMPEDGDVPKAIANAMRTMVPKGYRVSVQTHDYLVHTNVDGSRSIVFEVQESGG